MLRRHQTAGRVLTPLSNIVTETALSITTLLLKKPSISTIRDQSIESSIVVLELTSLGNIPPETTIGSNNVVPQIYNIGLKGLEG